MKTIKEVKEAKRKLERDIEALIDRFEKECEANVSDIEMSKVGICDGIHPNKEWTGISITAEL